MEDIEETTLDFEEEDTKAAFQAANEGLDLNKPIEKDMVGGFVDKTKLVGKTIDYKVTDVGVVPNIFKAGKFKVVLNVQDSEKNDFLLDLTAKNKNEFINRFGAVPKKDWVGKSFKAKYTPFEKDGMTGVTWDLV